MGPEASLSASASTASRKRVGQAVFSDDDPGIDARIVGTAEDLDDLHLRPVDGDDFPGRGEKVAPGNDRDFLGRGRVERDEKRPAEAFAERPEEPLSDFLDDPDDLAFEPPAAAGRGSTMISTVIAVHRPGGEPGRDEHVLALARVRG